VGHFLWSEHRDSLELLMQKVRNGLLVPGDQVVNSRALRRSHEHNRARSTGHNLVGGTSAEKAAEILEGRVSPTSQYDTIRLLLPCHFDHFDRRLSKTLNEFYAGGSKVGIGSLEKSPCPA
jgi:hypothetical protein